MKIIQTFLLICGVLLSNTAHSQSEPIEQGPITQLIITLAKLTDMGDACGEHMSYFGSKALQGAVCKEFKQAFYTQWASREALQLEIADHSYQLDQEQNSCERCQLMLERAEELRISITYHLDYMDFITEP